MNVMVIRFLVGCFRYHQSHKSATLAANKPPLRHELAQS